MGFLWYFLFFSFFFSLDGKETKGQGCTNFTKISERGAKGAKTRFAQTAAPS